MKCQDLPCEFNSSQLCGATDMAHMKGVTLSWKQFPCAYGLSLRTCLY